jgi:hypothetical protein
MEPIDDNGREQMDEDDHDLLTFVEARERLRIEVARAAQETLNGQPLDEGHITTYTVLMMLGGMDTASGFTGNAAAPVRRHFVAGKWTVKRADRERAVAFERQELGSEPITIGWARTPIGTTGQVRTASACVS